MPGGDRTGPAGMGPMTGRSAGYCTGYRVPGYMNPAAGRGYWGRGAWGGRGYRHRYYATGLPGWVRASRGFPAMGEPPYMPEASSEEQMEILKAEARQLERTLEDVKQRMAELEKESKKQKA